MKKFFAIILSVLLVFVLFACESKGSEPVEPTNPGQNAGDNTSDNTGDNNGGDKPDDGNKPNPVDPIAEAEFTDAQFELNLSLAELSDEDFTVSQLGGVDSLGREVLPNAGVNGKYVGMFYFLLLGQGTHNKIYDVTKLLGHYGTAEAGNALFALSDSPSYVDEGEYASPQNMLHYWGEPLYGYYKSTDKWVIRRHLELFMNAGIDFLYLDYTNSTYSYDAAVTALLEVVCELKSEGLENVPTLTFLLPNDAKWNPAKLQDLYDKFYSKNQYNGCWFRADRTMNPSQRPLMVGRFSGVDGTLKGNFWLKEMQWPDNSAYMEDPDTGEQVLNDYFPWIEWKYEGAGNTQPNHGGIMNVSVAQHINSWSSTSYTDAIKGGKSYSYRARGWTPGNSDDRYGIDAQSVLRGANFEWQWQNALAAKDDLKMVTVTGWNEWAAPKTTYNKYPNYAVFNDCFNYEFSRDAEMMKGGYGDNYYMQLARNAREFKGLSIAGSDNVYLSGRVSDVTISGVDSLPVTFVDISGDAVARTDKSVGETYDYADNSNRNNIVKVRVGNDGYNLYIAVTCADNISARTADDSSWMNVYLSCGFGGWEGYDFVIGRGVSSGAARIDKFTGNGSKTEDAGLAEMAVDGDTVLYTVPFATLGITASRNIGIKATDNLQSFGNIDDFYISGDCAPLGRLNYVYKLA